MHLLVDLVSLCGCSGGPAPRAAPAVVTPADFSVNLASASLYIPQGGLRPVIVSINATNGFSSSVQITLANLPAGVTTNPPSPFSIAPGANISVILGAAVTTAKGNCTVTAQAVSGPLSHSAFLALSIQISALANLPRTTCARTDATSTADDPPGEPHHRHIVYDPPTITFSSPIAP